MLLPWSTCCPTRTSFSMAGTSFRHVSELSPSAVCRLASRMSRGSHQCVDALRCKQDCSRPPPLDASHRWLSTAGSISFLHQVLAHSSAARIPCATLASLVQAVSGELSSIAKEPRRDPEVLFQRIYFPTPACVSCPADRSVLRCQASDKLAAFAAVVAVGGRPPQAFCAICNLAWSTFAGCKTGGGI